MFDYIIGAKVRLKSGEQGEVLSVDRFKPNEEKYQCRFELSLADCRKAYYAPAFLNNIDFLASDKVFEKFIDEYDSLVPSRQNLKAQREESKKEALAKEELLNIWKKNGFQGFVRCEPFENFLKIMRSGCLKSRAKLEAEGVEFDDVAMTEVIDQTPDWVKKYVRFYFKEKTPTFYRNEGIQRNPNEKDGHNPIPVCLIFSEKLINAKGTIVSNGGLGSKASSYTGSFCDALEYDWQSIFSRGPHSIESDDVKLKIKTKRDAEFLVPKPISIDFIDKIIFRCEADYNRAVFELRPNPLFTVDKKREMFNLTTGIYEKRGEDRNCLTNYSTKSTKSGYHVELEFYKSPEGYSHGVYATYINGSIEEIQIKNYAIRSNIMSFDVDVNTENLKRIEYRMNGITSAVWR